MWEYHSRERSKVTKFREDAEKEKQEGIQGHWQRESRAKDYLEKVTCCEDTDCTARMMKQAILALKGGDWEQYKSIFRVQAKATEWALDTIQEAFEKVAKDEARKLSTVQEAMLRSTDFLRRIIAPAGGQGGVTMSYLCPHCNIFPWKTTFGGSQRGTATPAGGVRSVEKNMIVGRPQITGGAHRRKCQPDKGLQSACGTAGPMWKLDRCTQVAGEPTRGWRRPKTEYCNKPL